MGAKLVENCVSQFEYAFRKYINPLWVPAATHDNEVDPIFFQSSFPSSLVVRWKLITPLCSLIIVIRHGERQPQPSRLMHSGLYGIKMGIKKSVCSPRPESHCLSAGFFFLHKDTRGCFLQCLQVSSYSSLLFNIVFWSAVRITSFSVRLRFECLAST